MRFAISFEGMKKRKEGRKEGSKEEENEEEEEEEEEIEDTMFKKETTQAKKGSFI